MLCVAKKEINSGQGGTPGWYFQKYLVGYWYWRFIGILGVCGPFPQTLALFITKICDIPSPIYDLTINSTPYSWPLRLTQFYLNLRMVFCWWFYRSRWKSSFFSKGSLIPLDQRVKTMPYFLPKWPKSIPYWWPKRLKNHTLWGRTYLQPIWSSIPPPFLDDCTEYKFDPNIILGCCQKDLDTVDPIIRALQNLSWSKKITAQDFPMMSPRNSKL